MGVKRLRRAQKAGVRKLLEDTGQAYTLMCESHTNSDYADFASSQALESFKVALDNPDLTVIDARKKTEYVKGHIEGAINMLNTTMERDDLEKIAPDKSGPILFYCNGTRCMRSSSAIKKAKQWDYTNLIWFRGGWKEWTEKRLPVVTD